jgi:integration host factor subunit alpha
MTRKNGKGQRIGRNPKTATEVPTSPRRVIVFKPSAILKQRINGNSRGWRCVSSCDVLDLLGYVLVAVF